MSKSMLIKMTILYTSFWIGRIKDRSELLNIAIDSEFLIVTSNWNDSLRAERKKEFS